MGCSSPSSSVSRPASNGLPVHLNEIGKECSVIAISKLFGITIKDVLLKIQSNRREHLFLGVGGMTKEGIFDMLKLYGIKKVDMRLFNNKYRINTDHLPFPISAKGVLALKFKGNMNTHWVSYSNGEIKDAYKIISNISELRFKYPTFDGFGHCVLAYTNKSEELMLESVYNSDCSSKDMCDKCIRDKYCFEKPRDITIGKRPARKMDV